MNERDNRDDPSLVRSGNAPQDDDRDALIDAMPGSGRLNEATDAETIHEGESDESTGTHEATGAHETTGAHAPGAMTDEDEPEVADEIRPTGNAPLP